MLFICTCAKFPLLQLQYRIVCYEVPRCSAISLSTLETKQGVNMRWNHWAAETGRLHHIHVEHLQVHRRSAELFRNVSTHRPDHTERRGQQKRNFLWFLLFFSSVFFFWACIAHNVNAPQRDTESDDIIGLFRSLWMDPYLPILSLRAPLWRRSISLSYIIYIPK